MGGGSGGGGTYGGGTGRTGMGGNGGGGRGRMTRLNCNISTSSYIYSATEDATSQKVGAVLNVMLRKSAEGVASLVAMTKENKVIGILIPEELDQIVECIGKKNKYVAKIVKNSEGDIEVEIHRATS